MKRTHIGKNDTVSPDAIHVESWGYDVDLLDKDCVAFSFSVPNKTIYPCTGNTHDEIHRRFPGKSFVDFRYFPVENLLTVWIYNHRKIVGYLKAFEEAYRNGDWTPFNIDEVNLVFVSCGDVVMCGFSELGNVGMIDGNGLIRGYHIMNYNMKRLTVSKQWKRAYFDEGDRAWERKHGKVDPALYHLIMYEE